MHMFEIEQRLLDKGITLDDIVAAAMELYVSHGMPDDRAAEEIKQKIIKYLLQLWNYMSPMGCRTTGQQQKSRKK